MTILITGGAGFIGSRLVPLLLENTSDDIAVLDNLHPQVHGANPGTPGHLRGPRVQFIQGDVVDPEAWAQALEGGSPATVYHLAAETGTGQSLRESIRHSNVNVNGTAVMMDALSSRDAIPERVLLTSSRAVYGEGRWRDLATGGYFYPAPRGAQQLADHQWDPVAPSGAAAEFTPHRAGEVEPRPTNVYAATKLAQENLLTAWCSAFGVDLTVLRLQNVYGAGQAVGNPYTGVLTYFSTQLVAGHGISVYEGGDILRDFVHVSDVARALLAAIGGDAVPGRHRAFDIGSGEVGTLHAYAQALAAAAGDFPVAVTDEYRLGDVRAAFADVADAREAIGYEPSVRFAEGASELLAFVRSGA